MKKLEQQSEGKQKWDMMGDKFVYLVFFFVLS